MRKPDRIRTAAALLACAATLLPTLGCERAPSKAPTPAPSPSPTGDQSEAPPFPAWDSRAALAAAYADALQPLPEITREMGSNWYGLTIDGGRIGTDAVATSFTPAEIMDELRRQQPVVEAVMKLSERKDRFPDGSPVVGVEDGIGSNAYRNARLAARLLCADAIRLLGEGKPEDAARRIAAGLNIVRQLSQGSDISSMVARGVFGLLANAIEPMTRGVNGHSFTPATKETILRSLEALDASAPFGPEMPAESLPQAVEQYARVRTLLTSGSR